MCVGVLLQLNFVVQSVTFLVWGMSNGWRLLAIDSQCQIGKSLKFSVFSVC